MAGADEPYDHLPFFYSDLFDRAERPRGVLLWNLFGRVDAARDLIRAGEPVRRGALSLERVG